MRKLRVKLTNIFAKTVESIFTITVWFNKEITTGHRLVKS